jgi:two-component system phosphate regulon sensor histidine kinase PhoR
MSDSRLKSRARKPRRRDIFVTVSVSVFVLAMIALSGEISWGIFAFASVSIYSTALIYLLTALSQSEPITQPSMPLRVQNESTDASQSMLERLPIPVLLIGPGGRIEKANPAARAFLGLDDERGLLSTVLRQPRVLEAVSSALRGEKGRAVEYSTMAPLESHVRAFVEPIRLDAPGPMPFRAMLVLSDDTSSKRAERMRADFLANASHELRTPLASLSGFIETLIGPARDDEDARDRFLTIMKVQTDRMRRLINDLLSLSRVEMNEHVAPTDIVDLNQIVHEVSESLQPVVSQRSITLKLDLSPSNVIVRGDSDQLHEVVENLLGNAVKYSLDGAEVEIRTRFEQSRDRAEHLQERLHPESGRLTVAAPELNPSARYGVVRVRDNGAGIARQYLPRLSERFFRVDGQKSGPKSGTGLGLAIVKHIVSRHRGGFTVESAPGIGSCFNVFVPAAASKKRVPVTSEDAESSIDRVAE